MTSARKKTLWERYSFLETENRRDCVSDGSIFCSIFSCLNMDTNAFQRIMRAWPVFLISLFMVLTDGHNSLLTALYHLTYILCSV